MNLSYVSIHDSQVFLYMARCGLVFYSKESQCMQKSEATLIQLAADLVGLRPGPDLSVMERFSLTTMQAYLLNEGSLWEYFIICAVIWSKIDSTS